MHLNDLTNRSERMLSSLVEAFHSLQLGRLPKELTTMQHLDKLLKELSLQVQLSLPDHQIATTLSSEYYKMDSIIWRVSRYNVIINIPEIISEKNTKPLDLFEIQTFHVPLIIHKTKQEVQTASLLYENYTRT